MVRINQDISEFINEQGIFAVGSVGTNKFCNISPRIFFHVTENELYWLDFFNNIGTGNQGVSAERDQIEYGTPASDFVLEIGTSQLDFSVGGSANTYDITGSPGLAATLEHELGHRVGDVVGMFLHDGVTLSGANATYTISDIRYVRIMSVKLTGPPSQRGVFVQPVSFVGSEVQIDPEAPSSDGLVGRLTLAR